MPITDAIGITNLDQVDWRQWFAHQAPNQLEVILLVCTDNDE
jgi:hypothetical protein